MGQYLKNEDLYNEVVKCKKEGEMSKELFDMFMLMIKNISTKFRYQDESIREDLHQETILILLEKFHHFDEIKYKNAFAYYTSIIKHSFAFHFSKMMGSKKTGRQGVKTLSLNACFDNDSPRFYGL